MCGTARAPPRDQRGRDNDRPRGAGIGRPRGGDRDRDRNIDRKDQKEKKDQKDQKMSLSSSEIDENGELKPKKEKREPSREGALTEIRLAPRENKDEVCRFYGTDKPCWAGERCPFKHLGKDGKTIPTTSNGVAKASEKTERDAGKEVDVRDKTGKDGGEHGKIPVRSLPLALLKDLNTPERRLQMQSGGVDKENESKKTSV